MNNCKQCQTPIPRARYKRIFCSKSCAATFNNQLRSPRTAESKKKTSTTLKALIETGKIAAPNPPRIQKYPYPVTKLYGTYVCHSCNKSFWRTSYYQKCCSIICRDNIRSQNKCRKVQIPYFSKHDRCTVILQSSWEVKIAEWLDYNNITWSRPASRIKWYDTTLQKTRTYLPDFYLVQYDLFVDVKNPVKIKQDNDKLQQLNAVLKLYVGVLEDVKHYVAGLAGLEPACVH